MSTFDTFSHRVDRDSGWTIYTLTCAGCGVKLEAHGAVPYEARRAEQWHQQLMQEMATLDTHSPDCGVNHG